MHELSLAESIVRVASEHARGRRVARVEVRAGALRQIVPSALEFAFELVAQGTCLDGAELAVEHVPAAGRCRACGAESGWEAFPLACRACGGLDVEVLRGRELVVDALELEDDVAVIGGGTHDR